MTAAHGLGWPGQPGEEGAASGDEVPPRAEPTGLDPAFAAAGSRQEAAAGEWPGGVWPAGEPGDIAPPPGPDGLGWPSTGAPPGPAAAGFGAADLGRGEGDVVIPVVAEPVSDTPIARAARAALSARSGRPAWPRPSVCRHGRGAGRRPR